MHSSFAGTGKLFSCLGLLWFAFAVGVQAQVVIGQGFGQREIIKQGQRYHVIGYNETLGEIAQRYGVTVDQLKRANGLNQAGNLHPGNTLLIPSGADRGAAPAPSAPQAESDLLIFRNGDRLHGTLVDAEAGAILHWEHPDVAVPIAFSLENVIGMKFGAVPAASPAADVAVVLTNDDRLQGRLVAMTDRHLQLDTWYAGTVQVSRPMIRSISPRTAANAVLYVGPNTAGDWMQADSNRNWSFRDGALYSANRGLIARQFELPDRLEMSFDLAWRTHPQLQVALYTDNLEQVNGNCYLLQISGNAVSIQRGMNRGFSSFGGSTSTPLLQRRSHARFTIYVDRNRKLIALFVDDQMVKQWIDNNDFAGAGNGVVINSQGQGAVRLSDIVLRQWSGEYPTIDTAENDQEDALQFINGDKVSGRLQSIEQGKIVFEAAFAALEVPLERVIHIELATDRLERARRRLHDVTALLHDGGRVTFELETINATNISGRSENFGRLQFVRGAFRELQFQIYDETIHRGSLDDWEVSLGPGNEWPAPMILQFP